MVQSFPQLAENVPGVCGNASRSVRRASPQPAEILPACSVRKTLPQGAGVWKSAVCGVHPAACGNHSAVCGEHSRSVRTTFPLSAAPQGAGLVSRSVRTRCGIYFSATISIYRTPAVLRANPHSCGSGWRTRHPQYCGRTAAGNYPLRVPRPAAGVWGPAAGYTNGPR